MSVYLSLFALCPSAFQTGEHILPSPPEVCKGDEEVCAPTLSFLNWPPSDFPAQLGVNFPTWCWAIFHLSLIYTQLSQCHFPSPGLQVHIGTGQTKGVADCQQSHLSFVPWTLPLGCGRTTPGACHLPFPELGLAAHGKPQISANKKELEK